MTLLAPIGWIGQWTDFGIWLVMPTWSEATYWEKYWEAKHKEQDKYGKKPYCKAAWKYGVPHVYDKPVTTTWETTFIWIGGY